MAAKRYSAGAIFLQVVPVFANVQRAIEDEAKNIDRALGDRMEKSGEKAGERAGKAASKKMNEELAKGSGAFEREFDKSIDGINKALGGINVNKLGNDMRREVAGIKRELAGLKDLDLTAEADFRRAYAEIAVLEGRLRGVRDGAKIVFRSDIDDALKGFAKVQAAKDAIEDPVEIPVSVDFKGAERQMTSFEKSFKKTAERAANHLSGSMSKEAKKLRAELKYLENLRIGVDISGNQARKELNEIMGDLERLQSSDPDIDVKVDSARALAEIASLEIALKKLEQDDIDIDVDVDTGRARAQLFALRSSGDDAANSFRSFNIILLAAAGAGPALIPMLAGIAGGLLAIGPAAGVAAFGLGAVLVGFSGLGGALQALQAQQDQMASSTTTAANNERNAAQAVADARRSAARAVEAALERQADAQERYRDSIDDVREAEQALIDARNAAKSTGANIKEQISDNALAQDQALLDVFNATVSYNAIQSDGSATNAEKEQARIDLENARDALADLRKEGKELAAEQKKWRKEGVNGTEEVQNAQEALNDALDAQREAYEDLGDAARDVDRARADGARQVAAAMQAQADSAAAVDTQAQNVATAFDKLGPAGERFALFLFGLREGFYDFRDDIQQVLLPAVQEAIEGFLTSPSASVARDALIGLADAFGKFVQALSVSFQGEAWMGFFQMLNDYGPGITAAYGDAFISFLEAMASIMTTLAPFALVFADGFAKMMDQFNQWAQSPEGQELIMTFMDYVQRIGPSVLEFFSAFGGALGNVLTALAPYGEFVLDLLTHLFDFIANVDPKTLGAVIGAVLILVTASQIAYAVMNIFMAGAALFASTVGLVVFLMVGIGLAIAYLYQTNEDFRDFIKKAWDVIAEAFKEAWEDHIKPALEELWEAIKLLWDEVLEPFFKWLAPILIWVAKTIIPLLGIAFAAIVTWIANLIEHVLIPVLKFIGWAFRGLVDGIQWAWKNVLKPVWDAISSAARWLWREVLRPVFEWIGEAWDTLMDGFRWAWEHVLEPVWDAMTEGLSDLRRHFRTIVDAIGGIWEDLQGFVGRPVRFIIETVLNNGLIAGFNRIARAVGADIRIDDLPVPDWTYARGGVFGRRQEDAYATGGVLPGYTPGRDVHTFVSPTAGRLNLSGGEAIMRPEFTKAVGTGFVDQMNALARSGGANAVRRALGGAERSFWLGGVLPLFGARIDRHESGYSGYAADMNVGAGYADYGMPVHAWKPGIAHMSFVGDASYGRWVDIDHGSNQFSRYAHLSAYAEGLKQGMHVAAGQIIGYVGDIGNTGTPATSHLHFEINGGGLDDIKTEGGSGPMVQDQFPAWVVSAIGNPAAYVADSIRKPLSTFAEKFDGSQILGVMAGIPKALVQGTANKLADILPGPSPSKWTSLVGAALDAAVPGDIPGLHTGGIIGRDVPYNGTMKYDNGGYLPPGLTTVVNLTGKPEPVFTNDQWGNIEGGGNGEAYHYEPHFEGSDLTAGDVAGDMNFAFRQMKRSGKHGKVGGS